MSLERFVAVEGTGCIHCGFCHEFVACPSPGPACVGCGACVKGCPQGARELEPRSGPGKVIRFTVNGVEYRTPGPVSVRDAVLEIEGEKGPVFPMRREAFCDTGGCGNCAVLVNGEWVRSCVTALRDGMEIVTDPERVRAVGPRRVVTVMRPAPHYHPSLFLHGCNYQCDVCHNWDLTFSSTGRAVTPGEAVRLLALQRHRDFWVGISGGEPTLNRPWLVQVVRELRALGPKLRIQVDTNGSLLTPDYVDELVEAGMTDLSPDLKARRLETFQKLCGISSEETARSWLERSWETVRYVSERYRGRVFLAVSLPYHPRILSLEELGESARTVAAIDPAMPVTLIEYQPAFRARDWPFLTESDMKRALEVVRSAGLQRVVVQGGAEMPLPVDPLELALGSEEF